jgi:MtN3 and saliva related transmembrane protein
VLTVIGLLAAVLTSGAWIPQVVKAWRTKSTSDLSWGYVGAFGAGTLLWIVYGLGTGSVPVLVANVFAAAMLGLLVGLKVRFG